jgi:acetoin utilization protein AcuB
MSQTPSRPRTVGEIMTTKVVTITPQTTVAEAIHLFVRHRFRHLLVTDEQRRLAGVLSDRDALRHMAKGGDPRAAAVGEIMKRDPVVATPETGVTAAIDQLRAHRINCLPVVDGGGTMLGIVTTTDLLGTLRALLAEPAQRA